MALPSAAQIIVSIIPIVGIMMGAVLAFFYLLWSHREKVRLIERGLYEERKMDLETFCLLSGLLLGSIGAVLSVLFIIIEGASYALLGGLIPLAAGISFLVFFSLRRKRDGA
jgi:heme/copper-type cytochrome/quinol oxidase subunit 2